MQPRVQTIVQSLVVVAWADGLMHEQEHAVLEAVISAFELGSEDAKALRDYAHTPRTLADLRPYTLNDDDRRLLLQHAALLTHADGEQAPVELATLHALARKLELPKDETEDIIAAVQRRTKRLLALR